MATIHQDAGAALDTGQLAGLLREAGGAEHDFLPADRAADYLSRLDQGAVRCIWAVQDGVLGAALLYSRFGPLLPIAGAFLRLEGIYVEEVMVTSAWRRAGWSRTLLNRLREIVGTGPDIYIDCDAANAASVAMMGSAGYVHLADYDDPDRVEPPSRHRTTSLFRHPGRPARLVQAAARGGMTVG
ncbi:GNAT family N-acetyltransferase [Actinomadura fibrosa]|uniref:GNAT family N-acetyltransferase n=1 Tax=Actinomadura fibrosa TaxID=111802 RepID=A0ABW2XN40_9ACTN|nr:GNAT family N-acetyltransferase [Actinomadura fibrosa]